MLQLMVLEAISYILINGSEKLIASISHSLLGEEKNYA